MNMLRTGLVQPAIPDLSGKIIFVTGGTSGLGKQIILALSKRNPKKIYFTGRNSVNAKGLIAEVGGSTHLTWIECDQTSLDSVSSAAGLFLTSEKRLDILICNAGVMALPPGLTKDGYEIQFGVNHLSHALLINLLLPTLQITAEEKGDARIVSIASMAATHTPIGGIAFDALRTVQDDLGMTAKWMRYGQSKLANVLYASQLAERYPSLIISSLEPGTVWTNLLWSLGRIDRIFLSTLTWRNTLELHEGAHNTCWAATTEKSKIRSGKMYKPVGVPVPNSYHLEYEALAERLWHWTEKQLRSHLAAHR